MILLVCAHFSKEIEKIPTIRVIEIILCDQWRMPHGKTSGFVSCLLFGYTLFIKLRNFYFASHWCTLIFLIFLDVVDLKLGCRALSCASVIGIVKTTALRRNLLCPCCYSGKLLILFQFNIGNPGDISLLHPCYILWIFDITCHIWYRICGIDH